MLDLRAVEEAMQQAPFVANVRVAALLAHCRTLRAALQEVQTQLQLWQGVPTSFESKRGDTAALARAAVVLGAARDGEGGPVAAVIAPPTGTVAQLGDLCQAINPAYDSLDRDARATVRGRALSILQRWAAARDGKAP